MVDNWYLILNNLFETNLKSSRINWSLFTSHENNNNDAAADDDDYDYASTYNTYYIESKIKSLLYIKCAYT